MPGQGVARERTSGKTGRLKGTPRLLCQSAHQAHAFTPPSAWAQRPGSRPPRLPGARPPTGQEQSHLRPAVSPLTTRSRATRTTRGRGANRSGPHWEGRHKSARRRVHCPTAPPHPAQRRRWGGPRVRHAGAPSPPTLATCRDRCDLHEDAGWRPSGVDVLPRRMNDDREVGAGLQHRRIQFDAIRSHASRGAARAWNRHRTGGYRAPLQRQPRLARSRYHLRHAGHLRDRGLRTLRRVVPRRARRVHRSAG